MKLVKESKKVIELGCKCNNTKHCYNYSDVQVLAAGYKGRLSFYVVCKKCGNKIYLDETTLSRKFVKKMYRRG